MTSVTRGGQRRAQTTLILLAASAAVLITVVVLLAYVLAHDPKDATATPATPRPGSHHSTTADVAWEPVAGVDLPISRAHGPRTTDDGRAAGYSGSEFGAALAAVHILVRTGANVGPDIYEPTITQQVTGANTAAMKVLTDQRYQQLRATAGVEDGEPLPGGNAEVLGYRIAAFADGTAAVEVVMTSPDLGGQVLMFGVALQRSADDWLVVAPPRGDWGAAATTLSTAPDGTLRYGDGG